MSSLTETSQTRPRNSNISVFFRILPKRDAGPSCVKILDDKKSVFVRSLQDFSKGRTNATPHYLVFPTDGVFYNCAQQEVFEGVCGADFFYKIAFGASAVILAYGQTGSGKTMTTSGLLGTYEDRGLLPRIAEKFFYVKKKLAQEKIKMSIKLKCVETNRNFMVNLLDDEQITYDMTNYKNINSVEVSSSYEALKLLFKAESHKTFRDLGIYKGNMANCITTFLIYLKRPESSVSVGHLHVVELAGLDFAGNSTCLHKTGLEVGAGNLAKSQLEQLILMLNERTQRAAAIKQRVSIIVHYLRDSLNNNSLITLIGHIGMSNENLKINLSMFRFACLFRGMMPLKLKKQLDVNFHEQFDLVVEELTKLKKEMDLNAMLRNEDLSMANNLSQERVDYIQSMAMDFLNDKNSEIVLLSTTDNILAMQVVKNIYKRNQLEMQKLCEQVKMQEERLSNNSKTKETGSSTKSFRTSNTPKSKKLSSIRSKVSETKKLKVNHKKELASVPETHPRVSANSLKSKNTPTRSSSQKRNKSFESIINNDESLPIGLPVAVPTYEEAWYAFKQDLNYDYVEVLAYLATFESALELQTKNYNKHVEILEEKSRVLTVRRHELIQAMQLKDLNEFNPDKFGSLKDLQLVCQDNLKNAEIELRDQNEQLLKLQAELRLQIDHRAQLKEDVNKKFHEFCMNNYNVLIPEFPIDDAIKEISSSKSYEASVVLGFAGIKHEKLEEDVHCKHEENFKELKKFMQAEMQRVMHRRKLNKKWMYSFQIDCKCCNKKIFDI